MTAKNNVSTITGRKGARRHFTLIVVVLSMAVAIIAIDILRKYIYPTLSAYLPAWLAHVVLGVITILSLVLPILLVLSKLKSSFIVSQLIGSVHLAQQGIEFDETFAECVLNKLQDLFYAFDGVGRLLCWNRAVTEATGYTDEEIGSMHCWDFFVKDDIIRIFKGVEEVWATGTCNRLEARLRTKDGRLVDYQFDGLLLKDDEGNPLVAYGTGRDMTEQKAAQAEIKKLSTAVEQSPASIIITDTNGTIEYVNDRFTAITGYTSEEAIGENPRLLKSGHTSCEEYQDLWQTITSGKEWRGEFLNKKKDGETYWESVYISPMTDEQGNVVHFLGVKEDITQRKLVERQLKEAKEAAENASRVKSEFLANMSHEIRTPMNGVIGMTELLLDTELDGEQRDFAKAVSGSAKALLTIIDDILDFSKVEAGQLEIENIPFDLRATIEEVAAVLAPKIDPAHVELIIHYDPETPRILIGDPNRIRQVLINLANNAIKFTEKGHVLISISSQEQDDGNLTVQFEVEDTGIGIPPDKLDHVFGKFTQADTSTSRKYGGTGLGLAICKQLVELMGGEVGVRSELDKGSCFWFNLGLPVHESNYDIEIPSGSLSEVRILVVDDHELNRKIFQQQLERWNIENDTCNSGQEALERLREARAKNRPYHMAILDYQMPHMNGLDLAKAIKDDPQLKNTILVMASSVGKHNKQAQLNRVGLAAYLIKPVSQSLLMNTLVSAWDMNVAVAAHQSDSESSGNDAVQKEQKRKPDKFDAHILVAEDHPVNRKLAVAMLQNAGCRVDTAVNGIEVLKKLETQSYDMILMDCQMPEMDGYEATVKIRQRESSDQRTLIVAMTANAMQGDRQKCIDAGMDDYIAKPINKVKFFELLHKYLNKEQLEPTIA
ncbi:MAG: response regulator [Sedimentisphaerales bacterium]|nr:response regulator [Sedimentisphaerales bacterium]